MFSPEQLIELASNLKSIIAPICRQHNLSFAQFLIINNIPSSGTSLKRLSMVVGTEISTMSRNIDKLLLAGLVIKSPGLLDRRQIVIASTPQALSLKRDIYKNIQNLIKVQAINKRYLKLKILGSGECKEKINIHADFVSKSAKLKIEKNGGLISFSKNKYFL